MTEKSELADIKARIRDEAEKRIAEWCSDIMPGGLRPTTYLSDGTWPTEEQSTLSQKYQPGDFVVIKSEDGLRTYKVIDEKGTVERDNRNRHQRRRDHKLNRKKG